MGLSAEQHHNLVVNQIKIFDCDPEKCQPNGTTMSDITLSDIIFVAVSSRTPTCLYYERSIYSILSCQEISLDMSQRL